MPRTALRRLGRRRVFDGRILSLDVDRVRLPNGRVAEMELVRHRGSVVLIPEPGPGRVILVRQFRYVIGRWIWELPAGSLEEGEAPGRAARRECAEEVGLAPGRIERLGTLYPTPGFCSERMIFYRCSDLRVPRRPAPRDPDEELEPRAFPVAEIRRMVARGEIVDMKTVVGLHLMSARPSTRDGRRR
ncbi:MAG: NUDIX hydrolase [Vicinamibacterales bacterium]